MIQALIVPHVPEGCDTSAKGFGGPACAELACDVFGPSISHRYVARCALTVTIREDVAQRPALRATRYVLKASFLDHANGTEEPPRGAGGLFGVGGRSHRQKHTASARSQMGNAIEEEDALCHIRPTYYGPLAR